MKYKVVTASDINDFNRECNIAISDGYVPQGSISTVLSASGYIRYSQAFVKNTK